MFLCIVSSLHKCIFIDSMDVKPHNLTRRVNQRMTNAPQRYPSWVVRIPKLINVAPNLWAHQVVQDFIKISKVKVISRS